MRLGQINNALHIVSKAQNIRIQVSSCLLKLPIKANVETKPRKKMEKGKERKKFGREKKKLLKLNGESLASRRNEVNVPSCASTQQSFVFIGPGARLFQDVSRPFICPAIRHCPRVPGFLRNFPDPRATLRYTPA